jgi:hypothetical protein
MLTDLSSDGTFISSITYQGPSPSSATAPPPPQNVCFALVGLVVHPLILRTKAQCSIYYSSPNPSRKSRLPIRSPRPPPRPHRPPQRRSLHHRHHHHHHHLHRRYSRHSGARHGLHTSRHTLTNSGSRDYCCASCSASTPYPRSIVLQPARSRQPLVSILKPFNSLGRYEFYLTLSSFHFINLVMMRRRVAYQNTYSGSFSMTQR